MTKRLYYSDPYLTQFEGEVVDLVETPDGPAVILKETYFYPESGGQPHDLGDIDEIPLIRVYERGEEILHVLQGSPRSRQVRCRIDRRRRRDHMQQHAGQHLLSAAFLVRARAQTVSFHLGGSSSTIDLDRPSVPPEIVAASEREANRAVRKSLPIRSYFIKAEEASQLKLRKAPEAEGILRIVDIEGFDRQACCGTHPANTAEVGPVLIRGTERFKGGTRVEFVCGDRALEDYTRSIERIRSLTRVLNSPEESLVEAATRLVEEKRELAKSIQSFREELLQEQAERWTSTAEALSGLILIVREVPDATPGELRLLTIFLTKEPSRVALIGSRSEGRAHLVFGRSANAPPGLDMSALLRKALPAVEGRGGGSPQIAQGGGPNLDGLDLALSIAREALVREISAEA